jgi:hypothetical protein
VSKKNTDIQVMVKKFLMFFIVFLLFSGTSALLAQGKPVLPDGFMDIKLGMDIKDVKETLKNNIYFNYRGDPDVSMLMSRDQQLIECNGYYYIEKGYFQFFEGKLFIITLVFNREHLDFYSMHQSLEEKYEKAVRLNPGGAYWENDNVSLNLEKPLSIKYLDKKTVEQIASGQKEIKDKSGADKGNFLKLF